jgi:hypothetical protein
MIRNTSVSWSLCFKGALLLAVCLAAPAAAYQSGPITKVEEDWEIVISEPDTETNSPQICVVCTPTGSLQGKHAVFEINNLVLPQYYGGGLQFQTWNGTQAIGERHHDDFKTAATAGEVITFTTSMRVSEGHVSFRVKNGHSTTWGDFGNNNSLWLLHSTDLEDMSGYSTDASVHFSKVGFGGNRVSKFVLKEVRYYSGSDLVSTDTTEHNVLDKPE